MILNSRPVQFDSFDFSLIRRKALVGPNILKTLWYPNKGKLSIGPKYLTYIRQTEKYIKNQTQKILHKLTKTTLTSKNCISPNINKAIPVTSTT